MKRENCALSNRSVVSLAENRPMMCLLVLLCVIGTSSIRAGAWQVDLKQVATSLAHDIASADKRSVTVADFTDLQGNVTELGRFLAEELSANLIMNGKTYSVVERLQLKAILHEHQLNVTGLIDPATARKLGQIAGVDALVTGTITPFSDSVRLTAKVLDLSTARALGVSAIDLPRTKAIDDLLGRNIDVPGTNETGSKSAANSATSPARLPSVEQNDLLFVIKACAAKGEHVICSGSVTNKNNKIRNFAVGIRQGRTAIIDNNGNSYDSDRAAIGQMDGVNQTQLMPDLPTNFYIEFPRADSSATQVNLVLSYVEYINEYRVLIRNIPLKQQ